MKERFFVLDVRTGLVVEALIVRGMSHEQFQKIMDSWSASKNYFREEIEQRGGDLPANDSWDWEDKAATTNSTLHQFVGVATDAMQGMMMLATVPQASRKRGLEQEAVAYVEYLESAPWNLPEYAEANTRYRGVGTTLLAVAVEVSIALGCEGRLALHSLPGSRRFYEKVGFERIEFDAEENLDWFELSGVSIVEGGSNGPA